MIPSAISVNELAEEGRREESNSPKYKKAPSNETRKWGRCKPEKYEEVACRKKDKRNFGPTNSEELRSTRVTGMEANLNGCASPSPLLNLSLEKTFHGDDICKGQNRLLC